MKKFHALAILTVLFIAGAALAAKIPPLPEVDAATAAKHPDLEERRARLAAERETLRDKSMKQKAACGEVEEGTPSERDCEAWLGRITVEVDAHVQATNDLSAAFSAAAGYKAFIFPLVSGGEGDYFWTADGRKIPANEAAGVSFDNRTTIFTGKEGGVRILLPDKTSFTIGPNSEMVLDDFVYDPDTSVQKMSARLIKGGFRWVTGKARAAGEKINPVDPTIEIRVITIGIRGTDFECSLEEDGTGFVKLYSGELALTHKTTGEVTLLTGGQMIAFSGDVLEAPVALAAV